MNRYMNENWKGVQKALRPSATLVVSKILTTVLKGITSNVAIKDIFYP